MNLLTDVNISYFPRHTMRLLVIADLLSEGAFARRQNINSLFSLLRRN